MWLTQSWQLNFGGWRVCFEELPAVSIGESGKHIFMWRDRKTGNRVCKDRNSEKNIWDHLFFNSCSLLLVLGSRYTRVILVTYLLYENKVKFRWVSGFEKKPLATLMDVLKKLNFFTLQRQIEQSINKMRDRFMYTAYSAASALHKI